jgi:hypothetical protein
MSRKLRKRENEDHNSNFILFQIQNKNESGKKIVSIFNLFQIQICEKKKQENVIGYFFNVWSVDTLSLVNASFVVVALVLGKEGNNYVSPGIPVVEIICMASLFQF